MEPVFVVASIHGNEAEHVSLGHGLDIPWDFVKKMDMSGLPTTRDHNEKQVVGRILATPYDASTGRKLMIARIDRDTIIGAHTAHEVMSGKLGETSITHRYARNENGDELYIPEEVAFTEKGARVGCKILGHFMPSELKELARAKLKNDIYIPSQQPTSIKFSASEMSGQQTSSGATTTTTGTTTINPPPASTNNNTTAPPAQSPASTNNSTTSPPPAQPAASNTAAPPPPAQSELLPEDIFDEQKLKNMSPEKTAAYLARAMKEIGELRGQKEAAIKAEQERMKAEMDQTLNKLLEFTKTLAGQAESEELGKLFKDMVNTNDLDSLAKQSKALKIIAKASESRMQVTQQQLAPGNRHTRPRDEFDSTAQQQGASKRQALDAAVQNFVDPFGRSKSVNLEDSVERFLQIEQQQHMERAGGYRVRNFSYGERFQPAPTSQPAPPQLQQQQQPSQPAAPAPPAPNTPQYEANKQAWLQEQNAHAEHVLNKYLSNPPSFGGKIKMSMG